MEALRYIEYVVTIQLDVEKCTGCRMCVRVCPHGVFEMVDKRASIVDRGACIECGACARNCAYGALSVDPGVGCADAIIRSWITGEEPSCGCSTDDDCGGDSSSGGACC